MSDILVTSPFQPFTLPTQFKAVFNGYIYCGTVDAVDPSVSQVQVYLVNESGDKVPVAQPLRTNAGGFMVYNGQPAKFVTNSSHSMLVKDSIGVTVWYSPDISGVDPGSLMEALLDRTMIYRDGTLSLTDVISVEDYRGNNPTDAGCIQAAITANNRGTIKLEPGRTYNLTSDITFISKNPGNPGGTLTLDATGAFVTGTGNIIFSSSKYMKIIGLQMPNQDILFNGLWYSSLESCVFRNLILSQSAGASFNDSYWNSFKDCNLQSIKKYAIGTAAHNEYTFTSCKFRGNIGQGFTGTADYGINLIGNSNTQSWKFYGGDISYHNLSIYNIDPANVSDVELIFDGVYFDTLLPQLTDRAKTTIRTENCHNAIGVGARSPLKTSFSAIVGNITDLFSATRSYRFSGSLPKNLIPGGDLKNDLGVWQGNGKPVNGAPAGTVFTSTPGGFSGHVLNIDTLGVAGSLTFKSQALPAPGKMTGCLILKNANPGEDTVQLSFNSLFEGQVTISDQYWTAFSLTSETMIPAGPGAILGISKSPAGPLNVSVAFAGIFYGTDTPMLCASDGFTTVEFRDTSWDLSAGIPANSQVERVFTVPGVAFGDFVLHASETSSGNLKKVIFSARVTAVDTVTVTASNPTAATISGLSATTITNLRVWKLKMFF